MKKIIFGLLALLAVTFLKAQVTGDTIVVKGWKYGSTNRDTLIQFPNGNLTFEKIILKYNMRCKNNLVSNQTQPNQGCGEWDYSCNTYIIDSTKIENALNTHPSHIISAFTGTSFNYVTAPLYDYYNYTLSNVVLSSIISETQYTLGTGLAPAPNVLKANEKSNKSQLLYTAAELTAAGFTPGNINGILLNVANAGGTVNFFKLGIQHSTLTALNASTVTLSGFTNVHNANYSFINGSNRVQFHTPFVWNGTDNLLLEFSFTNTGASTPIVFNGTNGASVMALYSKNNYALDLSASGHAILNASTMSGISNEISVAFWAYGLSSAMPSNTSLLYGYGSNISQRNLNLHLPWSDNSMYFDCGYSAGGYDRINKVSTAAEQGGQWNHWVFTKNAVTGNMRIYLNGVLWHSGTAKTKPISILNLILGKDNNLSNNWRGRINELSIWNKELSLNDIQTWMNKPLDATHPFYTNLLGYYPMNEGSGLNLTDVKNNLISSGVNLQWTYDRGANLTRSFNETTVRPNLVFLRGTYASTTNTLIVKDSLARNPNIVQSFSITSNAAVVPMANDLVALVSTTNLYQATPLNIYNGDTGALTGTLAVLPQGNITVSTLNYYKRYPYYNEIMSFVTPYGKGLSMGINGKTWYYDVTDFTPLLKGPKRMVMALGGEYQEQMDIDFWFIVGTPPRNVLAFDQLWQGAARAGGASIGSVNNDTRFAPVTFTALGNAQFFKVRSTITGHGAEGEFQQNGGVVNHYFNVNGGVNEFAWSVNKECSFNPIFPQGGTWVYDRQGWCPGESSLLKEYDLTPHITPSSTVTLDYNCSSPQNPSGDYRFIVANQVVTYGGINHTLDASIVDVSAPSNKVLYSRKNPVCNNPIILVRNTGSSIINDIEIHYWLNTSSVHQMHSWTGTLTPMDTLSIVLPISNLWYFGLQQNNNLFKAEIVKVNFSVDDYSYNNKYSSPFNIPEVIPGNMSIEFKTNNLPAHNTYTLFDDGGNVVGSSNFTAPNTTYDDIYFLNGCYKLVVTDFGNDGLSWWANTAQGSGFVRIKNGSGTPIKTFQPDFGGGFEYSFTTDSPVSLEKNTFSNSLNLYPNPAHDKFSLEGAALEGAEIRVNDVLGRQVELPVSHKDTRMEFITSGLTPGVYFITITKDNETAVKKVIIN